MQKFNNKDTLILVVDMIKGFCETGALASDRCKKIATPIKLFLQQVPLSTKAFFRDFHSEKAVEFLSFPKHCVGDIESELVDELKDVEHIDIPKNSTNGFFALNKKFPAWQDFQRIVIVGVCSDICVMQLALTIKAYLNENDKHTEVIVIKDLVETFDIPGHIAIEKTAQALEFMQAAGIAVP